MTARRADLCHLEHLERQNRESDTPNQYSRPLTNALSHPGYSGHTSTVVAQPTSNVLKVKRKPLVIDL